MKKFTQGFLAATLLGVGAIGTGIALNANANEYDESTHPMENRAAFYEAFNYSDDEALEDEGRHTISFRMTEDEAGSWELTDADGTVIDYGHAPFESHGVFVGIMTDEEGNLLDTPITHFFETDADYRQWLFDQGYDLEELGFLLDENDYFENGEDM